MVSSMEKRHIGMTVTQSKENHLSCVCVNRSFSRDEESFDWYQRWEPLKPELSKHIKETDKLLMVGCGNARKAFSPVLPAFHLSIFPVMSEDMVKDGYANIVNIDISSVVIKKMAERNPHMTCKSLLTVFYILLITVLNFDRAHSGCNEDERV